MITCTITWPEPCPKPEKARGLCGMHYERDRVYGDPLIWDKVPKTRSRRVISAEEWLIRYTIEGDPSECWEWAGNRGHHGYGRIFLRNDEGWVTLMAARVSYEHHVGPIPEGFEIDHLCFNPPCVNPAHLEAVTKAENLRRRRMPRDEFGRFRVV